MAKLYDVLIIGGGAIGSTIARELSRYRLAVGVLEKNPDILCETSGRNSGVIHAGFNNKSGTLMAKYCVEGCAVFPGVCEELGVPYKIAGKLVTGFSKGDIEILEKLKEQGDRNGCPDLRIISAREIKQIEPYVEGTAALYSPRTGIFSPFQYTVGMAENAVANGVEYFLCREVTAVSVKGNHYYELKTSSREAFCGRWLINSAGLHADKVAALAGVAGYKIYSCRGEYYVLDKAASEYLSIPVYPVPNEKEGGLGIHLTPTTEGNILIGPSSEYICDPDGECIDAPGGGYADGREDYANTRDTMDMLIREGSKLMPYLKREHFIGAFAGVRPKLAGPDMGGYADFAIIETGNTPGTLDEPHTPGVTHAQGTPFSQCTPHTPRAIHLIGMESPGLTASVPIARDIVRMICKWEPLKKNMRFNPIRKPPVRFNTLSDAEKAELIRVNPNYGEIVCRCQSITRQEVLDAIHNPLGAQTIVAIKNRTTCMMGRCQGGFCQTRIVETLMRETGKPAADVLYGRIGGNMFFGNVRQQ